MFHFTDGKLLGELNEQILYYFVGINTKVELDSFKSVGYWVYS